MYMGVSDSKYVLGNIIEHNSDSPEMFLAVWTESLNSIL